ncbi:MAG TPA: hypothetical protein PKA53_01780, partial [Sphingobacterium sp.]|nr:hypothetical protein [Sphingobacterium sp.]
MSKLLLCTFFLLMQHIALGQYKLDSLVHIANGAKHSISQIYDAEQKLLEVIHYEFLKGHSTIQWKDKFWTQYDIHENELVHIHSHWDSIAGQWKEQEKLEKQYDDVNRILSYTEYATNRTAWLGMKKTIYEYGNQEVTTTEYIGKAGSWVPIDKNDARFNENNDEILIVNYQWDSIAGDWAFQTKQENVFLEENVLMESVSYLWKESRWTNSEKVVYKYAPAHGKLTDRVLYEGTAGGWKLKQLIKTTYFDSARRDEIFAWSADDDAWVLESLSESYLDRYGRETDFLYKSVKYQVHFQRMTLFDEKGRITLSQEIGFDDKKSAFGTQTVYEFDEDGNLLRETDKVLDVKNAIWITQKVTEFTFDHGIILQTEGQNQILDRANIGDVNTGSNK